MNFCFKFFRIENWSFLIKWWPWMAKLKEFSSSWARLSFQPTCAACINSINWKIFWKTYLKFLSKIYIIKALIYFHSFFAFVLFYLQLKWIMKKTTAIYLLPLSFREDLQSFCKEQENIYCKISVFFLIRL